MYFHNLPWPQKKKRKVETANSARAPSPTPVIDAAPADSTPHRESIGEARLRSDFGATPRERVILKDGRPANHYMLGVEMQTFRNLVQNIDEKYVAVQNGEVDTTSKDFQEWLAARVGKNIDSTRGTYWITALTNESGRTFLNWLDSKPRSLYNVTGWHLLRKQVARAVEIHGDDVLLRFSYVGQSKVQCTLVCFILLCA
jgi:hypothetical protein